MATGLSLNIITPAHHWRRFDGLEKENVMKNCKKIPLAVSLVPVLVLAALLLVVIVFCGEDSMNGGSQLSILAASAVGAAIAMGFYGVEWSTIEKAIVENIKSSSVSMLILLLIGAISGSWMLSGIVPTMIYYGVDILHPSVFLVAACVISAVVSVVTGSSWTTCATIGVALMGVAYSLDFPLYWVAGAVISGAYFGDKISPLSDTTVLASSTAGVHLFTHIRFMLFTTLPSILVALAVYFVAGLFIYDSTAMADNELPAALCKAFNISPWLLLVPLFTFLLIARRVPVLITLFLSVVAASVAMVLAQPQVVESLGGSGLSFEGVVRSVLAACCNSTSISTGNAVLDELVATKGMAGMLNTIWLIMSAMCFGGVLVGSGIAHSITSAIIKRVNNVVRAVMATVSTGLFFNVCTGDQYMSIILACELNKESFDSLGVERRVLSRAVEDSATVVSVLIPWNTCAVAQSSVLGVPTFLYLPFCVFNLVSPFMSVLVAALYSGRYSGRMDGDETECTGF